MGWHEPGEDRMIRQMQGVLAAALFVPAIAAAQNPNPKLVVTPSSVTFTAAPRSGLTAQQIVKVTNSGNGNVVGLSQSISYAAGQPTGWLTASLSGPTAPVNLTLRANALPTLPPGSYSATVAVRSINTLISPVNVAVRFTVNAYSTTTVVSSTPNPSTLGQVVTFTTTVTGPAGSG